MTTPRELISELQERFGRLLARPHVPARRPRAVRPRRRSAPSASSASRSSTGSLVALRARAALRRVHGRRPRPPSRLAGVGGAGARERRRRGLPDPRPRARRPARPRRRRERPRRLRPRRRLARRRRQPQRVARAGGLPHVRRRDADRGRQRAAPAVRAAAEAARSASATRRSSGCPRLRERAYERAGARGRRLGADARVLVRRSFGNIVVNVRGRERDGIVEPGAEYEQVRDEIAARLLELRSPAGEPIVAAVHRREELFAGPQLEKIPDLIVEFRDYAWLGKGNLTGRTPTIWDTIAPARAPGRDATRAATGRTASSCSPGPPPAPGAELSAGDRRRRADRALPARRADPGRSRGPAARRGDRPGAARPAPAGVRRARRRSRSARRGRTTPRARPRSRSGCAASATSSSRRAARASRGRRAQARLAPPSCRRRRRQARRLRRELARDPRRA